MSGVHKLIYPNCGRRTPDGKLLQYKIRGHNIIHCYDAPHLIKVLRSNCEKKNLKHYVNKRWEISDCKNVKKRPKYASWNHVSELYKLDSLASQRLLPKLTDEHIKPVKLKMKVSVATQVFSKSVGDVMLKCTAKNQLPKNFEDTAYMLLFFNDLYDSINGSGVPQSGTLKGGIDKNSVHFAFWEYALSVLSNMNFIDISTRKISNRSTVLKKFESTIRGYVEITRICLNLNMSKVELRYNYYLSLLLLQLLQIH